MTQFVALGDVVGPILQRIGHDFARLPELDEEALATLHNAHVAANFVLTERLVAMVGGQEEASDLLAKALKREPGKAKKLRALFEVTVDAGLPMRPELFASHVAFGLLLQERIGIEVQRRASPLN